MPVSLEPVRKIIEQDMNIKETRRQIDELPAYGDYKFEYVSGSFVRCWFRKFHGDWIGNDNTKKLRGIVESRYNNLKIKETYTLVDFQLYNTDGNCVAEVGVNNGVGYVSVNCEIGEVEALLVDLGRYLFNADDGGIKLRIKL